MFLKSQFFGLSAVFYFVLFCVCMVTLILGYWEGSQGIRLFAAILGILYAFFAGAGKLICFAFGLLYSLIYLYIAWDVKLYGEVMLNLLYLPINLLGILMWRKNQNAKRHRVIVRSLSLRDFALCLLVSLFLSVLYGAVLDWMGGHLAYLNALSVVLQLLAFYLQIKRYVQNYMVVTLANVLAIVIWGLIYDQDSRAIPQLLNMCIFLCIGIYYWNDWAKQISIQASKEEAMAFKTKRKKIQCKL